MKSTIQSDPQVMQGRPVVAGTRITVESILERLAAGASKEDLLASHPRLTLEGVHAALAFAAAILRIHVDAEEATDLSPEWKEEIERRVADVRAGKVELIPGEVVLREARERLRKLEDDRAGREDRADSSDE